ncbi:unnamed protein product [Gadus morhua 'NCC']
MMEENRKRKVNFTDVEIRKLIELYSENKTALTAKQSNVVTNKTKQETWRFIMESLNSCSDSGCHRTDGDIKKKWKDLLSRAKKDVSSLKHHPTGGGPPPKTSPYSDIIVAIFGEDSPAFVGLDGVDSGCPQPPEQLEEDLESATTSSTPPPPIEPAVATPSCPIPSPPPATKRRRSEDLQQVLMEKEIVRVEKETIKLEAETKKIELEQIKLRLQIHLLQQQIRPQTIIFEDQP